MSETREEIERKLAEIEADYCPGDRYVRYLCGLVKSLLLARDVAEAAVAKQSAEADLDSAIDDRNPDSCDLAHEMLAVVRTDYDAALARYVAAEDKP